MFDSNEFLSHDFMMGFLMGRALTSPKEQEIAPAYNTDVNDAGTRLVDAILTKEMDNKIRKRLAESRPEIK